MDTQEKSNIEIFSQFIRRSVILKLFSIFILMLMLMIPMSFIQSLINERQEMRQTAVAEVSDKWANEQLIYGPILTLPYNKEIIENGKLSEIRKEAHILPSSLEINGEIDPRSLHRGIYEVVVYDSRISFTGSFGEIEKYITEIKNKVLWDEAFLTINISDLRGIKEKVIVNLNGRANSVEPGSHISELVTSGITVKNPFQDSPNTNNLNFSFNLHLQGSSHLGFIPIGKETNVTLTSEWKDPSFSGSFLPDARVVNEKGFKAAYRILELNRNYPQFWIGNQNISGLRASAFGVDLLLPMTDYQKAMRSAKYALLAISLTFLTFFLVEILSSKKVHPFQYILIGLALCLFYTLLVSISEQTNFDIAYIIASVSVITMIGLYSKSILKNLKQTLILVLVLSITYSFVYITLQVQDYALLIGSVGLTAILALTMYITRNIKWYEISSLKKAGS